MYNSRIRKITPAGIVTTIAGTGVWGFSGDGGPALSATFQDPAYLVLDSSGNLYVTDSVNNRIRKITPGGVISTYAGTGTYGYSGDGGPATSATFRNPFGMAIDPSGNIYVADMENHVVREINTSGIVSTVAGTGTDGYSGDGGPAISALLDYPEAVAWDSGNLYIWDDDNFVVRKVDVSGVISTFAGNGIFGASGDGGPALNASLGDDEGLAICNGNLYLSDYTQNTIRMVDSCGIIHAVAGIANTGTTDFGNGGLASSAGLNSPQGMFVDSSGDIYVAERGNTIRKLTRDCSPTPTPACTLPPTMTPTVTLTLTPTLSPTSTRTSTPTPSATSTSTPSTTFTFTQTYIDTSTPTITFTPTIPNTFTPTATPLGPLRLWPNPFDPSTAVRGTVKCADMPEGASLTIYTISGEKVFTAQEKGFRVEWDGKNEKGSPVVSGIYYYVVHRNQETLLSGVLILTL
jgi:sugar lactone lactonase YvrE